MVVARPSRFRFELGPCKLKDPNHEYTVMTRLCNSFLPAIPNVHSGNYRPDPIQALPVPEQQRPSEKAIAAIEERVKL